MSEAKRWIDPVRGLSVMTTSSLVIVELTGAYLTDQLTSWQFAWPKLAFWGVVLVGLLGGLNGRRLRSIQHLEIKRKVSQTDQMHQLRNPLLKLSLSTRIWLVLGILLLMVAKTGAVGSMSIILTSLALGLASSLIRFKKTTQAIP